MTKAHLFIFNENFPIINTNECLVKTIRYPNQTTILLNSTLRIKILNKSCNPQLQKTLLFPNQLINGHIKFYKPTGVTCDLLFANVYIAEYNVSPNPEHPETNFIELTIKPKSQQFIDLTSTTSNNTINDNISIKVKRNTNTLNNFLFSKN